MTSKPQPFYVGLARAYAGAILFSLPMLMTMEMWHLGFTIDPIKAIALQVAILPLLVGLSYYSGFERTFVWQEDLIDAFVAIAVSYTAAAFFLALFNIISWEMSSWEIIGKLIIQAAPASIGALLAQSQLGGDEGGDRFADTLDNLEDSEKGPLKGYASELFVMAVGALFMSLNIASTEEVILIAVGMTAWHHLGLVLTSIATMHGFVYAAKFRGSEPLSESESRIGVFFRFTVTGYALVLLVCAATLWVFGYIDEYSSFSWVAMAIVLGFPAAIGAAAARLVL